MKILSTAGWLHCALASTSKVKWLSITWRMILIVALEFSANFIVRNIPDLSVKSQCGHEFEYYFDVHDVLPPEIIEWAGFDEFVSNPSLKLECDNKISIAELNDNGKTFDEIANLIEAQL